MKKKKFYNIVGVLLLLFVMAVFSILSEDEKDIRIRIETPVIRIGIEGISVVDEGFTRVNQAIGDLSEEKYGFRIELVPRDEEIVNEFVFYNDAYHGIDIEGFYYNDFINYARKGILLDLAPYIDDYGSELKKILEEKAKLGLEFGDHIYGIPKTYSDIYYGGALLSKKYIEKYHMDIENIHTIQDMEPYFELIVQNEPDIIPYAKSKREPIAISRLPLGDILDGMLSVVHFSDHEAKVLNLYETKEYEERVRMLQKWREKGYLQPDIMTTTEYGQTLLFNDQAFAVEVVVRPDEQATLEYLAGNLIQYVIFDGNPLIDTECDWVYIWCITQETNYPKEAVSALQALYTDKELLTTLLYGIEGEEYLVNEKGNLEKPEKLSENNSNYFLNGLWQFNRLKAALWEGMDEDLEAQMERMKDQAVVSPAYGFWFDQNKVTVDLEIIKKVIEQYEDKLNCGMGNIDEDLPEFRRRLKEAGADQLVKEVQKQVDEWKKESSAVYKESDADLP